MIQEKISKAKKSRNIRTGIVMGAALGYFLYASLIPDEIWISPIIIPLSLGIGIGLLLLGFSLTLNYETAKKLIEMEHSLGEKIDGKSTIIHSEQTVSSQTPQDIQNTKPSKISDKVRAELISTILILIIASIFIYMAFLTFQEVNEEQTLHLPLLGKPYILTQIMTTTKDGESKVTRTDIEKMFSIQVDLTSTSLVANNKIKVSADFIFDDLPEDAWNEFDGFMLLVFPKAYNSGQFEGGETSGGIVKLNKMPFDPNRGHNLYRGYADIVFPLEDDYGYTILTKEMATDIKNTDQGDGTTILSISAIKLDEQVFEDSVFHVDTTSPYDSLRLAIVGWSLTYVIMGIGALKLRKELKHCIIWLFVEKRYHEL